MKMHTLTAAGVLVALTAYCAAAPVPLLTKPRERATLKGHGDGVYMLAFSPDGKTLASTGSSDNTIRLWNVADGKNTRILKHSLPGTIAFSPDGKTLASSHNDRTLVFWDVASGKEIAKLDRPSPNEELAFSPDGKSFVSAFGQKVSLWDLPGRTVRKVYTTNLRTTKALTYGTANKPLVAVDADHGVLALWDLEADKVTARCRTSTLFFVTFSQDGKVAATSYRRRVQLWDVITGRNLMTSEELPGPDTALAVSPDGKLVAIGWMNGRNSLVAKGFIRLTQVSTGKTLATLTGHSLPVASLAFSPDGRLLASGSLDRTIKLWDLPHYDASEK